MVVNPKSDGSEVFLLLFVGLGQPAFELWKLGSPQIFVVKPGMVD